jgi:hypothetical protein
MPPRHRPVNPFRPRAIDALRASEKIRRRPAHAFVFATPLRARPRNVRRDRHDFAANEPRAAKNPAPRDTHDTATIRMRGLRNAAEKFHTRGSRAVHAFGDFRRRLVISH